MTIVTASHLINMCPSTTLGMKKSEEVWSSNPPNLNKLRVFHCIVYAHIRKDKVELRSMRYMFLGYPEGVKAYRLWFLEPSHRSCITSRDVVFKEAEIAFKKTNDGGRNAEISEKQVGIGRV